MALDSNINRIKFQRSLNAGAKPTDLAEGEIAINLADRTLYSFDGTNIVDIGFGLGGRVKGKILATDTITSNQNVQADGAVVGKNLAISGDVGDGRGLALYNAEFATNGLPAYGMAFAKTTTFNGHGAVADGDWATYFTMNGSANRGWIFKNMDNNGRLGNVASISSGGVATFAKVVAPIQGNADTATRLKNNITLNGIPFTGEVSANNVPAWRSVQAVDDRTLKPNTAPKQSVSAYFTTKGGLNGVADSIFGDLLVMNTWMESSGGDSNALFFPKNNAGNPTLYRAPIGSSTWGEGKELAFKSDNVASAGKLKNSRYISTSPDLLWYKVAEAKILQTGTTNVLTIYGGAGYNALANQAVTSRLIMKTGNGNPTDSLGLSLEVIDGANAPTDAMALLTNGTWEIFIQFGPYFTGYMVADIDEARTTWTNHFVNFGANRPTGGASAVKRTIAGLHSNVASATKLQTPRLINGVAFDGTVDINIQQKSVRIWAGSLDDYGTEGHYYCDADADAVNIANKPIEGSFALEVIRTAGVIQRFTNYITGRTWIRKSYTGWGPWSEIALLNRANIFTEQQYIDGGNVSVLNLNSSGESAVVFYKPTRRVVATLSNENIFGFHDPASSNGWLLRFPNATQAIFGVDVYIPDGKSLIWQGTEGDNIGRVQNANGVITTNSPEPGIAAIRNAMQFNWYNNAFQIGTIRSGSQDSHGFGITYGNSNLMWHLDKSGTMFANNVKSRGYLDSTGNVTGAEVISRSGRFSAPNSNFHYIDVGVDGRDLTTFGQYGGAFRFLNSSDQQAVATIDTVNGYASSYGIKFLNASCYDTAVQGWPALNTVSINGTKPDAWSAGYKPIVHASIQSESGYRQHAVFGAYKLSNNWTNGGAYIAIGGASDAATNQAFHFGNGAGRDNGAGLFTHTSGWVVTQNFVVDNTLTVNSSVVLPAADLRSNSHFQFLTGSGGAQRVATGGLLASDRYSDVQNIPTNGIWSRGKVDAWVGVGVSSAAGGIHNGIFPGNGDAATYDTCNLDIQTWNGLGIKDNAGNRRTVFDARNGDVYTQGSFIAGRGISAPYFQGKATEVAVGSDRSVGATLKATWQGCVFYNAGCTAYVVDGNNLRLEAIPLKSLGRFIEAGKSKVHIDTGHGTALRTGVITSVVTTSDTSFYVIVNMPNHGIGNGLGMGIRAITYSGFGGNFTGALQNTNTFRYTWKLNLDSACFNWPSINVTASTEWDGRWGPKDAAGLVGCGTAYDKSTVMFMVTDNNSDNNAMTCDYVSVQVWDVV